MQLFSRIKNKIYQLLNVCLLGITVKDKIKIFITGLIVSVVYKIHKKNNIFFTLKLCYRSKPFTIHVHYPTDFAVIHEVFIDREYDKFQNLNPGIIFDLGSNVGASVKFYNILYPNANVFSFEPNPEIFKWLQENTKDNSNNHINNCAISSKTDKLDFYIDSDSNLASSLQQRKQSVKKISVDSYTLKDLLDKIEINKIDLLKIDVEGAEAEIFKIFDCRLISNIIGELHVDIAKIEPSKFANLLVGHKVHFDKINNSRYIFWTELVV